MHVDDVWHACDMYVDDMWHVCGRHVLVPNAEQTIGLYGTAQVDPGDKHPVLALPAVSKADVKAQALPGLPLYLHPPQQDSVQLMDIREGGLSRSKSDLALLAFLVSVRQILHLEK